MCPRTSDSPAELAEELLGELEGQLEPLDGGITNRNFKVRSGGRDYVLRVFGRGTSQLGIHRSTERLATEAAARAGVGPPLVRFTEEAAVTEFVEGEAMPELRVEETARALRLVHEGPSLPSAFDVFRVVDDYRSRAARVPPAFERARALAEEIELALRGPEHDPVPCHNDLLNANLIWDGERVWIVDWEYAGMGDRYFDLGNLSINNGLSEEDDERLLTAYFGEPCTPRRVAALRLMRIMSDFREAMWGVLQQSLSELDFDFEGYASEHFERLAESAGDPRCRGWLVEASRG
jgi:thiamine kinase-like enzyme